MESSSSLSDDVSQFIRTRIDSVPHMEALLLLWESAPEAWDAERIAARIYVTREVATQILRDLVRHKLASEIGEGAARFSYASDWDEGSLMAKVAETYRRELIVVASLIHSKASSAVREFARAFEIKKDD